MADIDWDDSPSAGDCVATSEWDEMVTYIKHSSSCTFTIYDDEASTNQKFKFTYSGDDSIIEGANGTMTDLVLKANTIDTYPYIELEGDADIELQSGQNVNMYEDGTRMFSFQRSGVISYLYGGSTTGDDLVIAANSVDSYPNIGFYAAIGRLRLGMGAGEALYLDFAGIGQMVMTYAGNISHIYGGASTGDDLHIHANQIDNYPWIKLYGDDYIALDTKTNVLMRRTGTQSHYFYYNANVSVIAGGGATGDDLYIKANTTDAYPSLYMSGNSTPYWNLVKNGVMVWYARNNAETSDLARFRIASTSDTIVSLYGGNVTGNDLIIYANSTDAYPFMRLLGNDGVYIENATGDGVFFKENGTTMFNFYSGGGETIMSTVGSGNDYMRLYTKRHLIIRSDTDGREALRVVSEATKTTIMCGPISGDDLKICANSIDSLPYIELTGLDYVGIDLSDTKVFKLWNAGSTFIEFNKPGASTTQIQTPSDFDLYLKVQGTGLLKYGTETTNAGSDRGKLIAIKTQSGDTVYVKTYDLV